MEYRKFNDTIVLRLELGEEVCESLLGLAEKENIRLAEISGLGASKSFTIGVFKTDEKKYYSNSFEGSFEIVSLVGTLTRQDGKPYLHAHFSAGDDKGHVFGGHLNRAVVNPTAEIIIRLIPGSVGRKFSEEVGINLFHFE